MSFARPARLVLALAALVALGATPAAAQVFGKNKVQYEPLDWGVLDLLYELMGFAHFRRAFDLAERASDEGPICNLALITQYLARFQVQHGAVLSARFLDEERFVRTFFSSFLYALWRRGESEYEDAEDPFPKGRIPFLTVHQAKGLEIVRMMDRA